MLTSLALFLMLVAIALFYLGRQYARLAVEWGRIREEWAAISAERAALAAEKVFYPKTPESEINAD